ncbi:hypothetical protein [Pectobacterium aroidearum]|uniref:hypothetical protein n=1 Tax=Pectobacterium aroidearum TaxID=1201031 RepID=UPI0032EF2336
MIKITIATEDILSEKIVIKLINEFDKFEVINSLGKKGNGYIFKNIKKFHQLSFSQSVLIVLDLDNRHDVKMFANEVIGCIKINKNLKLSISVREIESWLLADKEGMSDFLQISKDKIPVNPELLLDPKEEIIKLAKKGKNTRTKNGIPPQKGAISKMGLSYNTLLTEFVENIWSSDRAKNNSASLRDILSILKEM